MIMPSLFITYELIFLNILVIDVTF